jgi:hypothetical protein
MKNNLVELRKQAEQAVHDMPDGDLKVKAFETFLQHLLSGNAGGRPLPVGVGKKSSQKQKPETATPQIPKSFGDRVLSLKTEGFFAEQRSIGDIRQELKKNGWHYPLTSMSGPLQRLVQNRELRRERVDDEGSRKGWKYSDP